ncbi:MAG TPA: hypothetical protein VGE26_09150 [Sphingobacteriaceae bacterium]
MNIQETVQNELNTIIEEGKVHAIIKAQLEKTIKGLFDEALREYSDFGKQIREVVQESLKIDLSKISTLGYQQIVTDIVREQLQKNALESIVEPVTEAISGILQPIEKRTYKLSEILEEFKRREIYESEGELTLCVEHSSYGSIHIGIDEKPGKNKYSCDVQFSIDAKDKKIYSFECGRLGTRDLRAKSLGGGFNNFLFNLHASQCPIEVDEHACET